MSNSPSSNEPRYEVLWPLSHKGVKLTTAAARLPDLNGKVIAELWDVIFRGEVIYPLVREYIKNKYPQSKVIEYTEFGNVYGPRERDVVAGLAAELRKRKCDAVIVGIGA